MKTGKLSTATEQCKKLIDEISYLSLELKKEFPDLPIGNEILNFKEKLNKKDINVFESILILNFLTDFKTKLFDVYEKFKLIQIKNNNLLNPMIKN